MKKRKKEQIISAFDLKSNISNGVNFVSQCEKLTSFSQAKNRLVSHCASISLLVIKVIYEV